MASNADPWRAYLLRCGDGSLYAGVSNDVRRRLAAHTAGRGARYTRARLPVGLAWTSPALEKRAAHRLEARLKRLERGEKLVLIGPDGRARRRLRRGLLEGLSGAPGQACPATAPRNRPDGCR